MNTINTIRTWISIILIFCCVLIFSVACDGSNTFDYVVHVIDEDTNMDVKGVNVSIQISGQTPIQQFTGNDGVAVLAIPSTHINRTGKLIVKNGNVGIYNQAITISEDSPMNTILITSINKSELANSPADVDKADSEVIPQVYEMMTGWPGHCDAIEDDGKIYLERSASQESKECLKELVSQKFGDFTVEWEVKIDGRAAIFLVGEDSAKYWMAIIPSEQAVEFQVARSDAPWSDYNKASAILNTNPQESNTIALIREKDEIFIKANGQVVHVLDDVVYSGEEARIGVGIGISGLVDTQVTISQINVHNVVK